MGVVRKRKQRKFNTCSRKNKNDLKKAYHRHRAAGKVVIRNNLRNETCNVVSDSLHSQCGEMLFQPSTTFLVRRRAKILLQQAILIKVKPKRQSNLDGARLINLDVLSRYVYHVSQLIQLHASNVQKKEGKVSLWWGKYTGKV
jgi:predicted protein tyrosine phosphatase